MRLPQAPKTGMLTRRHTISALVLGAVIFAPLAIVSSAPANAATGTPTSSLNLSNNPRLARSTTGYSIQEGGSNLTRISVSHVAASRAARVISTGPVTRVREPREAVRPGGRWVFASDVQASRRGATAQITVSWYTASGRFLSWSGGQARRVNRGTWTSVAAHLYVPRNAAIAQTLVNVAHTASGARVRVTQHVVRAPVATSTPTPGSSMAPPAGATLVKNLSRASYWERENGGSLKELAEKGPGNEPVLRSTLVDGQTGAGSAAPNERNDLTGGTVPLGSIRWMTWYERFVRMPTTNLDRWQVIGPSEIHGNRLPQATAMPEVGPGKRRRLNANAGRATTRYFDLGRIVVGRWSRYKFGVHYTQGSNGWLELWKDGVRVMRASGPTTTEASNGYWKFGHYRNADINGTSIYDVSGVRIYGR